MRFLRCVHRAPCTQNLVKPKKTALESLSLRSRACVFPQKLNYLLVGGTLYPFSMPHCADRVATYSSEQGDAPAQANLARLYKIGRGVPRDFVQAYRWYRLSQRGTVDHRDQLRELAAVMSADQVADAEQMVNKWHPLEDSTRTEGAGSLADLLE